MYIFEPLKLSVFIVIFMNNVAFVNMYIHPTNKTGINFKKYPLTFSKTEPFVSLKTDKIKISNNPSTRLVDKLTYIPHRVFTISSFSYTFLRICRG